MDSGRLPRTIADFRGISREGKFSPGDAKAIRAFLHDLPNETVLLLRFEVLGAHRTVDQNAWYWGVIVHMIGKHIGIDDPKAVHDYLKELLNYRVDRVRSGDRWVYKKVPLSTANYTRKEFSEYCERVRRWALFFLGLDIPDPV